MKKSVVLLLLLLGFIMFVSGQEFDITGTYLGETDGMTVRIDVHPGEPEGFRFSFISLEEESHVFVSDYSETGEYTFEDDGEFLKLNFEDGFCIFDNGSRDFHFMKQSGDPLSPPGYYTFPVEDDVELVLKVEEVGLQYTFTFEAWETETVISAPGQAGNTFQLTSDWGDTVNLEFTPVMCIFSGDSEDRIKLIKE